MMKWFIPPGLTVQELEKAKRHTIADAIPSPLILYKHLENILGITTEQADKIRAAQPDQNRGITVFWLNNIMCFSHTSSEKKMYRVEDCSEFIGKVTDKITLYNADSTIFSFTLIGHNDKNDKIGTAILKTYNNNRSISYQRIFFNYDTDEIIKLTRGELRFIKAKANQENQLQVTS